LSKSEGEKEKENERGKARCSYTAVESFVLAGPLIFISFFSSSNTPGFVALTEIAERIAETTARTAADWRMLGDRLRDIGSISSGWVFCWPAPAGSACLCPAAHPRGSTEDEEAEAAAAKEVEEERKKEQKRK
jgi:hypothetical protein